MRPTVLMRVLGPMLAVFAAAGSAHAVTIDLSTGLGLTTAGQPDTNWVVGGGTLTGVAPAQLLTPSAPNWFGDWVPNDANSQWIGVTAANVSNGYNYSYQRTFSLTPLSLSTVSLSGSWTIDDGGVLLLNGFLISSLGSGNWGSLTAFSVPSGSSFFNSGLNTLTVLMTYSDNYLEGARLQGQITGSAVPLPAAVWLFVPGLLAVIAIRRRLRG